MKDSENEIKEFYLISVLAVLLKHRKFIICIMCVSFIVICAGYFFYPRNQFENKISQDLFETTIEISINPVVSENLPFEQYALFFKKPVIINKVFGQDGGDIISESMRNWSPVYISAPRNSDPNKKYYESYNKRLSLREDIDAGIIEISFLDSQPAESKVFLLNLFREGDRAAREYLFGLGIESDVGYIFSAPYTVLVNSASTQSLSQLKRIYIKRSVVILFFILCVSIIIVFIAHSINKMRKDEEVVKIIRNAIAGEDKNSK